MDMAERRRLLLERLMSGAVQLRATQDSIPVLSRDEPLPLSAAQKRILFVQGLYPDACFNGSLVLKHSGEVDSERLYAALSAALARHDVLRTNAFYTAEGAFGRVNPPIGVSLEKIDLRMLPPTFRHAEAIVRGKKIVNDPFDLFTSPALLRAGLIIIDERESLIVLAMHMFGFDAPSGILFAKDMIESYRNGGKALLVPDFQYADYIGWSAKHPSARKARDLDYWVKQLGSGDSELQLPTDKARAPDLDFSARRFPFRLDNALVDQLKRLSQANGATFYMIALAALMVLLHRHSGAAAISVGTWTVTRDLRTADLVGPFVNTLVHRAPIAQSESFVDLLAKVRTQALGGYAHSQTPFDDVVSAVSPTRSRLLNPLFQVHFLLQETGSVTESDGFSLSEADALIGASGGYDVELVLRDLDRGVEGHIECNASLFDERATERFALRYLKVLQAVAAEPNRDFGTIRFDDDAKAMAATQEPDCSQLHTRLDRIRGVDPDAIAVICRDGSVTYRELLARIASFRGFLETAPRDALLVLTEDNGPVLYSAIIAALWYGLPFVSLGPDPKSGMIEQLDETVTTLKFAEAGPVDIATQPGPAIPSETTAFLAISSGTTGKPSQTAISREALANLISQATRLYDLDTNTRLLQTTRPTFDVLLEEVLPVLCAGGTIVVSDHHRRGVGVLSELACLHQVTTMNLSSSLWEAWLHHMTTSALPRPETLSLIVIGSEPVSIESIVNWRERFGDSVRLVNAYGTAETAITCSTFEFGDLTIVRALPRPPIGKPLAGFSMAVIDRAGTKVPSAVVGELVVSGIGLGAPIGRLIEID
jgi:non-ribosomal peptide synthetase component F